MVKAFALNILDPKLTIYGLLAHAFRQAVIELPRVQSWLRRSFAAAFAGLGAHLALSEC